MLEYRLFGSPPVFRRRSRLRPMVLAVFSYRYDAELVPDLLANIEPMVDGWVALDDRRAAEFFSSEPLRRRLLIERAKELGASWVLAIDPDERIERGGATRIRGITAARERIVWEFNLREMFGASSYRVDGVWGLKKQRRLFPVFDGPLCSEQPLHGAWCLPPAGYTVLPTGLNLYHLKMLTPGGRLARRDLYRHLDPGNLYQKAGYDYLVDENGAAFEEISPARDFFPAHRETGQIHMADVAQRPGKSGTGPVATDKFPTVTHSSTDREGGTFASQLGQLRISMGERVRRDCRLAVIVIGLCAPKSLFDAVRSLVLQDTPSEIIVVNSGGGDVSNVLGDYLQDVVLVELAESVRVGAARNIGIQVSRAPFVGFLAGDCIATAGWVAERTQAHMDGECAVASVVDNDKPRNPFAWASHLMTYGHRMAGANDGRNTAYGASYDRALFDKYGYFSETMLIGEDSEFHARLRPSDAVWLHQTLRTVHSNPAGPGSFLKDQFRRGLRGRYLADFLRIDFTAGYIALATVGRLTRPLHLSLTRLAGKERVAAMAAWPLVPVGATFYCCGMIISYLKASAAERLFQTAERTVLLGQPTTAIALLRRAIDLRPVTARYHLALSAALKETVAHDDSARELHTSWDIERQNAFELHGGGDGTGSAGADAEPPADPVRLQMVVFHDSSDLQLAEFLKAIRVQRIASGHPDVLVVDPRDSRTGPMLQVRRSYADFATFVSPRELPGLLSRQSDDPNSPHRSFVVVASSSCALPPDWLAVLRAYIVTYPEIELFHGNCRPQNTGRAGFIERMSHDLGLFPRTTDHGGTLCFAHAANWACNKSVLVDSGGLTDGKKELGLLTLTERVMKAGASGMYASDWQSRFRFDSTLTKLLRRFYQDGHYGAEHVALTRDHDAARFFSGGGLKGFIAAAWRFATVRFKVWRFANRPFLLHSPAFLLLLSTGVARQLGWLAGLRRLRMSDPASQAQTS